MANFTPEFRPYKEQGQFRFWCQKVLPLVYDDSLSYYELLNKVIFQLNVMIDNQTAMEGNIGDLLIAYNLLQEYVNHYFENLDVQNEINAKLDEMASTGALTDLLSPFIPELVTNWLNSHITPTSPAIDKSLLVSGAGADSGVTGAMIRAFNSARNQMYNQIYLIGYEQGGIYTSGANAGTTYPSADRTRSLDFIPVLDTGNLITIPYNTKYILQLLEFNASKVFVKASIVEAGTRVTLDPSTRFIKYQQSHRVTSAITANESNENACFIYDYSAPNVNGYFQYHHVTNGAYSHMSDLPAFTVSYVSTSWFDDVPTIQADRSITDRPNVNTSGIAETVWCVTALYGTFGIQVLLTINDSTMYTRIKRNNAWEEWKREGANGEYVAFGDSITFGVLSGNTVRCQPDAVMSTIIGNSLRLKPWNIGNGGQGFFANAYESITAYDELSSSYVAGVLGNAKLVTLAWGRNDGSHALGSENDTTGAETIAGKLKQCIEYVRSHNSYCEICVIGITPAPTYDTPTGAGWTVRQADEVYRKVCEKYCIKFVSWNECRLFGEFASHSNDGVHPNGSNEYRTMGHYLAGKVGDVYR